jgi:hypothetical protein
LENVWKNLGKARRRHFGAERRIEITAQFSRAQIFSKLFPSISLGGLSDFNGLRAKKLGNASLRAGRLPLSRRRGAREIVAKEAPYHTCRFSESIRFGKSPFEAARRRPTPLAPPLAETP